MIVTLPSIELPAWNEKVCLCACLEIMAWKSKSEKKIREMVTDNRRERERESWRKGPEERVRKGES